MSASPLLEIENLSTHYVSAQGTRVVRAVDQVSLRINAGETLGIVGESGSGKSTLALTILRVLPPAAQIVSGKMLFEGEDLLQKSDVEMQHVRGKRIAMILQDPMASLNPLFTIGDQVAEPIRVHERANRRTARQRAQALLQAVRIPSPDVRLLSQVSLRTSTGPVSDVTPDVLSLVVGAVTAGPELQVRPVDVLQVQLWRNGKLLGILARRRELLPGRYAFGLTGRGPDGSKLAPGRYQVRVVALPGDGTRPQSIGVDYAIP